MRYLTIIALTVGLLWPTAPFADGKAGNMLHHVVLVWLKDDVNEETKTDLIERTRLLDEIEQIQTLHVGSSLASERAIVDDSFDFGIHMTFASREDMEQYLADKRHTGYVEQHVKPVLKKLTVYDF